MVQDNHPFQAPLLKAFRRKIKRQKKINQEDDGGTEADNEEEDDDLDDDFDEDDDVDDSCPPGCDATLYEHVIELRDKRLDQEEVLTDFQRVIDDLKRTLDRHNQRKKQIERDLNSFAKEIQSFQTEKQQHLNQLHTICSLHLNQVHIFNNNQTYGDELPSLKILMRHDYDQNAQIELPPDADITNAVLFSRHRLEAIYHRIGTLEAENRAERANFKELHRVKSRLERAKVAREAQIAQLRSKCDDLQMLKFGQLIKLELLDRDSQANKGEEELYIKVKAIERQHLSQIQRLQHRQEVLKERLLSVTKVNTEALTQIATLSSRQFNLESKLGTGTSNRASGPNILDSAPTIRIEVEERNRLVALVKLQGKEIDALKAEINLLRRKGGHVYMPTQYTTQNTSTALPSIIGVTPGISDDVI